MAGKEHGLFSFLEAFSVSEQAKKCFLSFTPVFPITLFIQMRHYSPKFQVNVREKQVLRRL